MSAAVTAALGVVPAARHGCRQGKVTQSVASAGPLQSAGRQLVMNVSNRRQLSRPSFAARAAASRAASGSKGRLTRLAVSADAAAVAVPEPAAEESPAKKQIILVCLFVIWYLSNIFFNIWNKQLLKIYSFPLTGTYIQLGIGSVLAILMWTFRLKKAPKVRSRSPSASASPGRAWEAY